MYLNLIPGKALVFLLGVISMLPRGPCFGAIVIFFFPITSHVLLASVSLSLFIFAHITNAYEHAFGVFWWF